jgi:hypothetical protein
MGVFVPEWVIFAAIVIFIIYYCGCKKSLVETFLTPFGLAPKQADLFELSMRRDMFPH